MRVERVSLNLAIPSPLLTTCGSSEGRDSGPVTGGAVTLGMDAQSLSCVLCFATPWAIAHQAPLSMGFSRQEY